MCKVETNHNDNTNILAFVSGHFWGTIPNRWLNTLKQRCGWIFGVSLDGHCMTSFILPLWYSWISSRYCTAPCESCEGLLFLGNCRVTNNQSQAGFISGSLLWRHTWTTRWATVIWKIRSGWGTISIVVVVLTRQHSMQSTFVSSREKITINSDC